MTDQKNGLPSHPPGETTVIVIGAGPSGLSLGRELRQRGIDCVVLEQGSVGHSWQRMPKSLKLVSPWKCNWISPKDSNRHRPNDQLSREGFLDYLREHAAASQLSIISGCKVFSVRRHGDFFRLETSRGEFVSRIVVNATGYFSNPIRPKLEGADTTEIPQFHFADYKSAEHVRAIAGKNPLVLIVGKRLSAGQAMLELVDAGMRVALSHRTPIRFGVDDWLWPFVYRHFAHAEKLKLLLSTGRGGAIDVRMPGGRTKKLIESGVVTTFPATGRFEKSSVVFANSQRLTPGLVLYTTGFAPALQHLASMNLMFCSETGIPFTREMESVSVPNLFFLGFEMLRNFQSRFLRGIRNDAVSLAAAIAQRLDQLPQSRWNEPCLK